MIELSVYKIFQHPEEGKEFPTQNFNNGCDWLRKTINKFYTLNREDLMKYSDILYLFHNHNEKTSKTVSSYPLIQYQRINKEYFVVGINNGALLLGELFKDQDTVLQYVEPYKMIISILYKFQFEPSQLEYPYNYKLTNWLPFRIDKQNMNSFQDIKSLSNKILFLEERLKGHILKSFVRDLSLNISHNDIVISITDIDGFNNELVNIIEDGHIHPFQPFTIKFSANLKLPSHICLGNKCAYGFGLLDTAP